MFGIIETFRKLTLQLFIHNLFSDACCCLSDSVFILLLPGDVDTAASDEY